MNEAAKRMEAIGVKCKMKGYAIERPVPLTVAHCHPPNSIEFHCVCVHIRVYIAYGCEQD